MAVSARPSLKSAISRTSKWSLAEFAEPILVIPPDGGWGWVVCIASFMCNFIVDGTMYCFGVFLPEISKDLEVEETQIALVSSLLSGFYYILGPLNCAACNHYGFRAVGFTGGILAAGAFVCASYLHHLVPFLLVTGVWVGLAFNLVYTPAAIAVGFYFEKWRALALSLVVCGTASGIVAFPPLMTRVLSNFSWRIKFRILAGLCLFCSLLCLAFKPIKAKKVKIQGVVEIRSITTEDETRPYSIFQKTNSVKNGLYTLNKESEENVQTRWCAICRKKKNHEKGQQKQSKKKWCKKIKCDWCCKKPKHSDIQDNSVPQEDDSQGITSNINRPKNRDDIFYTSSITRSRQPSKISIMSRASRITTGPLAVAAVAGPALAYTLSVTRAAALRDKDEHKKFKCCPDSCLRTLATMLDVDMFKSPSFMILAISGCLSLMGLYIPLVYVAKRATDQYKIEEKTAVLLLTIIGVANLVGRISCTLLSLAPRLNINILTYVSLIICGIVTFISSFLNTFALQAFFCVVFGFTISTFNALRAILFIELFGLENLTTCFGINMLFQSLASFLGVPIANALYGASGDFFLAFAFSGGVIVLSGILLIPVEKVQYWEENRMR